MTRCRFAGVFLAALFALCVSGCPKPASPDRRGASSRPNRAAAKPPAKSYTVRFGRPVKVGMRYKIVATTNMDTDAALNGKPYVSRVNRSTVTFAAVVTVKAVHASGQPTREELKILKLQRSRGGKTTDLLPAGSVVLAFAVGKKEHFSVLGKPVGTDAAKALEAVMDLYTGDLYTSNDFFGPQGEKRPGDTWKIDSAKMLSSLRRSFKAPSMWPKPENVGGQVTFTAVKRVKGAEYLELKAKSRIRNIAPGMGQWKVTGGTVDLVITSRVPADPKRPLSYRLHTSMTMHLECEHGQGGKVQELVMDIVQVQTKELTLLP